VANLARQPSVLIDSRESVTQTAPVERWDGGWPMANLDILAKGVET
jgi:hypothetical protein